MKSWLTSVKVWVAGLLLLAVISGVFYNRQIYPTIGSNFILGSKMINNADTLRQNDSGSVVESGSSNESRVSKSFKDDPFASMTIPYLREQEWSSRLADLNLYSSNSQFDTYLTSYQSEGLTINGLLTKPTGDPPPEGWPAVVFVHGYIPPSVYKTTERYQDYVAYLARNDLVVFKIDLRGHGDSEGVASGAYYSGDYVIDTLNAYQALRQADFVNDNQVGLWGHSMGGNVVLRAVAAQPTIPAAVIWAGSVFTYRDWEEYGINDNSYRPPSGNSPRRQRRQELLQRHGQFNPQSDFWRQVVPTNYLDEVQTAIQLHHAANDNVVDVRYSQNLNQILSQTDVIHQLYIYEQGGHNLTDPDFSTAMRRTVEFYKERLR